MKLRPERLECLKWLTAHNSFSTNWHPLLSIKQWTPDEPKCIFVPISSADHTIYHCSIPAHNKLWFHCPVQACLSIGWDDVTLFGYCKKTTGFGDVSFSLFVKQFVVLGFRLVANRFWPEEKTCELKYRNLKCQH